MPKVASERLMPQASMRSTIGMPSGPAAASMESSAAPGGGASDSVYDTALAIMNLLAKGGRRAAKRMTHGGADRRRG